MEWLKDYWDFFVLIEKSSFRSQLGALLHPTWTNQSYVLILAGFVLWETLRPWRPRQRRLREGFGLDLFYTVFNYVLFWVLIGTAACELTKLAFQHFLENAFGVQHLVAIQLGALPVWGRYLLLLLALDFTSYWGHWLLHRFDVLWEFHKIHHSARELDVLNAARLHWFEKLFYPFVFYIPLSLIGFEVRDTFVVGLFISIFSNFTHANVKLPLGPLKYVLNNPQMHIWHHAAVVHSKHNVNYGDALSMWDYLFGTAYIPDDRSDLELGFEGIDAFPTGFGAQLVYPFQHLAGHPTERAA